MSKSISSRQRLASLEKAIDQLQTLNRLSAVMASKLEVKSILQDILRESMNSTGADGGSILSFEQQTRRPVHTLYKAPGAHMGPSLSGLSDLIGGWVLQNNRSLVTKALAQDSRFPMAKEWFPEIKAVLAVPMRVRDALIGIIILLKKTPFSANDLELMNIIAAQCGQFIENAKNYEILYRENLSLRHEIELRYHYQGLIGRSAEMQKVFSILERIIPGEARILIEGESGTGKELIARVIHHNGPRREKKFVAIDCGAMPENLLESELFGHVKGAFTGAVNEKKGLIEIAHKGTLFLDEIGNTSFHFQAKLLRAIQEGEIKPVGSNQSRQIDVRVIAACNRSLQELVEQGQFRQDLFYRLNVVTLRLPPLRHRKEDIRLLADHFIQKFAPKFGKKIRGLVPQTLRLMEGYAWPGNIRELENVIERALTLAPDNCNRITPDLLPEAILQQTVMPIPFNGQDAAGLNEALNALERHLLLQTLEKLQNNRSRAAKALGITRQTLIAKLKKHNLHNPS